MSRIFARNLAGKKIVTVEGTVLGELENIILDADTGRLIDLIVYPNSDLHQNRYQEDGKFIRIPFDAVCALKDYIVVDANKAEK
ncbi:MAG: PRC-barrel domain-containing protein [Methanotrichaceae archaeon]